ncbi:MAG: peptidoglycan DD-metalloendopeptidase family protein [Deltaproteobacteria bacterium]|nr:peptidoglycan DD-metalloendopeptidase family protein [Deltaproteobacteria bacterium]
MKKYRLSSLLPLSGTRIKKVLRPVLLAVCLIALLLVLPGQRPGSEPLQIALPSPPTRISQLDPGPWQIENDYRQRLKISKDKIGTGDTLARVLERGGLPKAEIHQISQAAAQVLDVTKVKTGGELVLWSDPASKTVLKIEYSTGLDPRLIILKTSSGYIAVFHEYQTTKRLTAVEGSIKSSFWEAAVKQYGVPPDLVMAFADLFAYEVDFLTEIQPGDTFRLLYEQEYSQGQIIGHGRILAAQFETKGRKLEVYYYSHQNEDGKYYDASGRSLKKMFLKSPLQYSRITSFFTNARMHPILKIYRPHEGVDYAAPQGTPIDALGDGQITFLGWNGGFGNFIEIKHNRIYTTAYGHLSAYAKGLKKGDHVKQGQLIGYVGATGLATGPHLDFRVKENNKFIDPLTVKFQPSPPLESREKSKFMSLMTQRRTEMANLIAAK